MNINAHEGTGEFRYDLADCDDGCCGSTRGRRCVTIIAAAVGAIVARLMR
jgi:hypothetical protein